MQAKWTFKPNQWTKKCFYYYESVEKNDLIEAEIKKIAIKTGYASTHEIIIKNKPTIRSTNYIDY